MYRKPTAWRIRIVSSDTVRNSPENAVDWVFGCGVSVSRQLTDEKSFRSRNTRTRSLASTGGTRVALPIQKKIEKAMALIFGVNKTFFKTNDINILQNLNCYTVTYIIK